MDGHLPRRESHTSEENIGLLELDRLEEYDAEHGFQQQNGVSAVRKRGGSSNFQLLGVVQNMNFKECIVSFLRFLVPSFLQGQAMRNQIRPAKLHPTAYLDGMRGLAALSVFFCHYCYQSWDAGSVWGMNGKHYNFLSLPIVQLIYNGPVAVNLFFIISGYALSYRPLKFIHSRNYKDFATATSSMTFRRMIRLYLPTAMSTLMIACLLQLGVYELTRDFAHDKKYLRRVIESHPSMKAHAIDQLKDWASKLLRMVYVFAWDRPGPRNIYDVHLWTISVEYRSSLYLFLFHMGTARLKYVWRFVALVLTLWFTIHNERWEFALFLLGIGLADWDHHRKAHVPKPELEKQTVDRHQRIKTITLHVASVYALFLMSYPGKNPETTPGYGIYPSIVKGYRVWSSIGACLFMFIVSYSQWWQRVFNSALIQYLGKISYALYLMHGPIIHTAGYMWMRFAWGITGIEGSQYRTGWILGAFFVIPSVIWAADIFWRAVDIPSVKFAKWFEQKLISKD